MKKISSVLNLNFLENGSMITVKRILRISVIKMVTRREESIILAWFSKTISLSRQLSPRSLSHTPLASTRSSGSERPNAQLSKD